MATAPAALPSQAASASGVPFRLLHGWHLLSLDAPTVAFCWTLLFERCVGVPRPVPAALALACAVWLIYVLDRVLDAFTVPGANGPLHTIYRQHWQRFAIAGLLVCAVGAVPLTMVRREVAVAWVLLVLPLALYGIAVHRAGLSSRWKSCGIGLFFAVAVVVPCLPAQPGPPFALVCAAMLFGEVCRQNCTLLQRCVAPSWPGIVGCACVELLLLRNAHLEPLVVASVIASVLLHWLSRERARLHPLTFRALADAALVLPVLVWLVR